ncbi:polycystic kidney disease 1-like 2 [Cichlidogyrus casuarinus]|uniref:Polycystic kidney disease 1-like 2 n=1 Tax=Cichlidogyrus casuarinus TaxID=1844966 RepID=A0ABD2PSI5_9PLAT
MDANLDRRFDSGTDSLSAASLGNVEICKTRCGMQGFALAMMTNLGQSCLCGNSTDYAIAPGDVQPIADCASQASLTLVHQSYPFRPDLPLIQLTSNLPVGQRLVTQTSPVTINWQVTTATGNPFTDSSTGYYLSLSYSDNPLDSETITSYSGSRTVTFPTTGQNVISMILKDSQHSKLQESRLSFTVAQSLTATDLNFTCPPYAGSQVEFACSASFQRGTNLWATFSYGTSTENFVIPTPEDDYSPLLPLRGGATIQAANDGTWIIGGKSFQYNGYIDAIYANFLTTGSPVTFKLIRPTCNSNEQFVYSLQQCSAQASSHNCGQGFFSHYIRDCVAGNSSAFTCPASINMKFHKETTGFSVATTVVYVHSFTPNVIGHTKIDLAGVWRVQIGDRLMVESSSMPIGFRDTSTSSGAQFQTSDIALSGRLNSKRYEFGAVSRIRQDLLLPFKAAQKGPLTLTLTLQPMIGAAVSQSVTITVLDAIDRAELETNVLERGVPTQLKLQPFTGSPVHILWTFTDGSNNINTSTPDPHLSHTFNNAGLIPLTVTLSNIVNTVVGRTTLQVNTTVLVQ